MKTYKLRNKEIELTEEEVKDLVRQMEGSKGEKYFFPEEGETFYYATQYGTSRTEYEPKSEDDLIISGGVYRTKELAEKARDKQKALVRMWKWVQENDLFWEPDFSEDIARYFPSYHYSNKFWSLNSCYLVRSNYFFPHFKTIEDCQKFIDNNLSDLNLFI